MKVFGFNFAAANVLYSVLQGLIPIHFSLLVNGIKLAVPNCKFFMFAVYFKLFRTVEYESD